MECTSVTYKLHAIEQMFKRGITKLEVEAVIGQGETIATYPDDKPYPSVLRLGFVDGRPIHMVLAQDAAGECFVVTTYEPAVFIWESNFKNKKR